MIKAIIVDDEPLAHEVLKYHIDRHGDIDLVAQMKNATEAMKWLVNHSADLIFLDVNMPELSGVDMLKVISKQLNVIIVSAHKEYALEGFELDVLDYLLKPIDEERFDKAILKFQSLVKNKQPERANTITIKQDRGFKVLSLHKITLIQGYGNYVKVWQGDHMDLANSTLKSILDELPLEYFVQVNKSSIISKAHVKEVHAREVRLTCGQSVKLSKLYISDIKQLVKAN
ncbi:LytTR family DNA-binding domain-containing protein [uncultured Paraglaciecola sp.]|uniref:LytR/AlgR family response regulator transcription factor n=1 Tax=uncultured Paraglaciecola sp. TaxID=1765024 RepID=UPI0026201E46|nr:response regulator transcription factor [uncultured Paraglaciecola sp.]